jgi:hypothetical protein
MITLGWLKFFGDHRLDVAFPPFREGERVVERGLWLGPHVEGLVHHEHPDAVAGVQGGLAEGVVGAADGVEPGRREELDPALVGTRDGCRSQEPVVVVDAGVAEIHRLSVDPQPALRVELQRADPEGGPFLVESLVAVGHGGFCRVQVRSVPAP